MHNYYYCIGWSIKLFSLPIVSSCVRKSLASLFSTGWRLRARGGCTSDDLILGLVVEVDPAGGASYKSGQQGTRKRFQIIVKHDPNSADVGVTGH